MVSLRCNSSQLYFPAAVRQIYILHSDPVSQFAGSQLILASSVLDNEATAAAVDGPLIDGGIPKTMKSTSILLMKSLVCVTKVHGL